MRVVVAHTALRRQPSLATPREVQMRTSPFLAASNATAGGSATIFFEGNGTEGASMSKKVADQIAETLAAIGVQRIYGVVGDSLNGITDSLRRQAKIDWVHMRHEEAGAFAAGAEAHLTGKLAVCAGSCGPGNLHLINGLFDCHRSAVPVLAIAAHIPTSEIGSGYFQETHPQVLFKECSHYCELVSGANQMPRTLEVAIREAVGKRGVSVIVIPGDVALQTAADAPPPFHVAAAPRML